MKDTNNFEWSKRMNKQWKFLWDKVSVLASRMWKKPLIPTVADQRMVHGEN